LTDRVIEVGKEVLEIDVGTEDRGLLDSVVEDMEILSSFRMVYS
jgi:hypothetical protein